MYDYEKIKSLIRDKIRNNFTSREIYDFIRSEFKDYDQSFDGLRRMIYRQKKLMEAEPIINLEEEDSKIPKFVNLIKKVKVISLIDLCNNLNLPPKEVEKLIRICNAKGYEINVDDKTVIFDTDNIAIPKSSIKEPLSDSNEITFGIASDLHLGSKSVQLTALNEFTQICMKHGVEHMFVPGDVFAGFNVYKGQATDLYAFGAEDQLDSAIINIPKYENLDWIMMGGNHDASFIRNGGQNLVLRLSKEREDIIYVGFDDVNVPLLNNVDLKMWHPSGGQAYSISYKLQKAAEQITMGELQNIVRGVKETPTLRFLVAGHLHIQMQALFGSIWGAQAGCFEGQTDYLKRKGLVPAIGGWIVKATLSKNRGLLKNFEAKFYIFEDIEDDWRNYKHTRETDPKNKIIRPLFK